MKIHIISHCWALEHVNFAVFLRAQMSSLYASSLRSTQDWHISVVHDRNDPTVIQELGLIQNQIAMKDRITPVPVDRPQCWRKCIGWDVAARGVLDSDLVWFTTCEYLFTNGCLDAVASFWEQNDRPTMIWPKSYWANKDKKYIDTWSSEHTYTAFPMLPNPARFSQFMCSRAIGGVQIVSGDYVKEFGYLRDDAKYQAPPDRPFPDSLDTAAFRLQMENTTTYGPSNSPVTIAGISALPQLFRMRYSFADLKETMDESSDAP